MALALSVLLSSLRWPDIRVINSQVQVQLHLFGFLDVIGFDRMNFNAATRHVMPNSVKMILYIFSEIATYIHICKHM